jgi:hypothetical protein
MAAHPPRALAVPFPEQAPSVTRTIGDLSGAGFMGIETTAPRGVKFLESSC